MPESIKTISISAGTVLRVTAIVILALLFFAIWRILASIFLAIVVAAALEPTIKWLTSHKLHRFFAVALIYLLSITAIVAIFYAVLPNLFNEVRGLSQDLPIRYDEFFDKISDVFGGIGLGGASPSIEGLFVGLQNSFVGFAPDVVTFATSIFGGLLTFVLIIVISFYLSLQDRGVERFLLSFTPADHKEYVADFWRRVEKRLGRWLQAQFVMAVFIGLSSFLLFWLLGVKYAVTLAIIAGFLEIIPVIGPAIASIIAFGVISLESMVLAAITVAGLFAIQQLQQHLIIPAVMSRVVGLNPVLIIIALLVGFEIAGLWGIIMAIPLVAILGELFRDIQKS